MKLLRNSRFSRSRMGNLMVLLFLLLMSIFMVLPFVYTVANAFKPLNELFLFPPRFFPKNPTTDNFLMISQMLSGIQIPISRYIFNSVFIAVVGTALCIFIDCMAAYPLAKFRFKGSLLISVIIQWAILFRAEVTAIPTYIVVAKLGIINTYAAILFPAMAGTFGVYLMQQFMSSFPMQVIEAARIDGAGEYQIFGKIVMPNVKVGWITLIIFTFQAFWGNSGGAYVYDDALKTLPTILSQFSASGIARAGAAAAIALVLMLPSLTIFIFTQSNILETMAYSGIKG